MPIVETKKALVSTAAAALVVAAGSSHAATNQELENRVDHLERMLRQTQAELQQQEQRSASGNAERANTTKASKSRNKQPANGFRLGEHTTLNIGGSIKLDALYSDHSDGDPGDDARLFYFPNRVPVSPPDEEADSSQATDFTARQTRINLTTITHIGGHKIKGFVETDFYGGGGNEVVTNSANPRLRHAFLELDDTWLFGQTWSNFMDLAAYPETLDFIGPAESVPFIRQPQIRYTQDNFAISLENPEITFDNIGPAPEEDYPSLVASYKLPTALGHLGVGAVVRDVTDQGETDSDDSAVGYGVRVSGTIGLGPLMGNSALKDEIRFLGTYSDGLGRYVGVGSAPGGYVQSNGDVDTVRYYGGYIDFKHYWSEKWRSNLVLGTQQIDNDDDAIAVARAAGNQINKQANSIHFNLLWNPVKPLLIGGEYLFAQRELESDANGTLNRFQFSAKYAF